MFTKLNLSLSVLALSLVVGASAQERHYDKPGAASLNSADDVRRANEGQASSGQVERQYDKAGIASLNRIDDVRGNQAVETMQASQAAVATEIRTQRGQATDVSFDRSAQTMPSAMPEYVAPVRSSAHKATYYSVNSK